jgi:hypothetical protein
MAICHVKMETYCFMWRRPLSLPTRVSNKSIFVHRLVNIGDYYDTAKKNTREYYFVIINILAGGKGPVIPSKD